MWSPTFSFAPNGDRLAAEGWSSRVTVTKPRAGVAGMAEDKKVRELDVNECLELLSQSHLGRLAFIDSVGVLPIIVPVNYVLYADSVVLRTDPGSKLAAAVRGAPVAFEIDGLDEVRGTGWSVVVRGHAEVITDTTDLDALQSSPPPTWAPGAKAHFIRVDPSKIAGRRITRTHSWSDWWE
jgi:nitroimidazol reductase NimA-like FMN-containing flavoprotein (pyridoxamine 5'-phosphate oxidase superfamily)